jgi:P27 family predicted phage terminase small subunit
MKVKSGQAKMAGRKQLPKELKILKGTFQKCRDNKAAPVADIGLPVPASWLSARGVEIFNGLVVKIDAMNYASNSHSEMLSMLALRFEQIEICTKKLNKGYTYSTSLGIIKLRPEVALLNEATRHAQSLSAEFGLSPASKGKVSVAEKKKEDKWGKVKQA